MSGQLLGIPKMNDILETALRWHQDGLGVALATVVETWGSAPRPVGSQLVIGSDGGMVGSVSGGCVEGAVIAEGLVAIEDGRSRALEFGVSDDDAFAVGLACGAQISRIHTPVGADIGAKSPPEIAISIMAELTERLRRAQSRR